MTEKIKIICSRCIYDNVNIPKISFDDEGVCNYCRQIDDMKLKYKTGLPEGEQIFEHIVKRIKKDGKNNYLSIKKFWLLNDDCIWNILSFSFQFFQEMIRSNAYLAKKIYLTLNNKFSHVIYSFREKFNEFLELEEFLFRPGVVKKHRATKPSNICYIKKFNFYSNLSFY